MRAALETQNGDFDLTSEVQVFNFTTPATGGPSWYVARIDIGDGVKDLDGTGGDFEAFLSVNTVSRAGSPQTQTVFGGETKTIMETEPFLAFDSEDIDIDVLSPNVADSDVDVTVYLQDLSAFQSATRGLDVDPSTAEQVGNISTGAGGLSALVSSFVKSAAEPETNTFTATQEGDGVFHIVQPDTGTLDAYYQAIVSAGGKATSWTWLGYVQAKSDEVTVWYWDWSSTSYKQITTLDGANGTTPVEEVFIVPIGATGTGADEGKSRLRFLSSGGTVITNLATDRLLCEFSQASQTVGYANGAIWVNTNGSNTNTTDFVDGTADNPVSTWAAALNLSASLGIKKFQIVNGSTIQLSANSDNFSLSGAEWTLDLNGQSCDDASFTGAHVTGTCTGGEVVFRDCDLASGGGTLTVAGLEAHNCALAGSIVLTAANDYYCDQCYSAVAGTATPSIDCGAAVANTTLNMRHYSGGIELKNLGANGTDKVSLEGHGQLILNANCDPSNNPVIAIRGHFPITDNVAGGFVAGGGVLSDTGRFASDDLSDDVRAEMDANSTKLAAILADVTGINGDAMRGTDGVDTAAMRGTDNAALDATGAKEATLNAVGAIAVTIAGDVVNIDGDAMRGTDGASTHSAADVWTSATRTLTSFGSLVADIATAVWAATTRTLTAFGFTVTTDSASRTASKADVSALALEATVEDIQKAVECDITVDTSTTPWQFVFKVRGTATELYRKDLTTAAAANVVADTQLVGNMEQP